MRKQYKNKKRSCKMCKPHKRGLDNRWKKKDQNKMKMMENEIIDLNKLRKDMI